MKWLTGFCPFCLLVRSLKWLTNLAMICLLLGLILILVSPRLFDLDLKSVASGSMQPSIPVGALVVIQPVDIETILPGDIITFLTMDMPDAVVTHRVLEVTVRGGERVFRTQGDANEEPDLELVPASSVLGRVILELPYLGFLSQFIRTRRGWFLIVVIPAMILIFIEIINILKVIWTKDEKSGVAASDVRFQASTESTDHGSQELGDFP